MTQAHGSLPQPIAPDYDCTLVLAIELSNASWVLAAQVPGLPRVKAKRTIEPTAEALLVAIEGYRDRAKAAGRNVERVVTTYEASWSGFWLARWLARNGIETHVIQPSSVPVDRRVRRAKSDGIDAELLLRTLLAWLRGEPRVCSMVPIPAEADEDARRCVRERADLIAERVGLANRIDAVLATLGARCQIAFKADPLFASNCDPLEGAGSVVPVCALGRCGSLTWCLQALARIGVGAAGKWPAGATVKSLAQAGHLATAAGAIRCCRGGDQLRFLNRQLVLPVSMISQ